MDNRITIRVLTTLHQEHNNNTQGKKNIIFREL